MDRGTQPASGSALSYQWKRDPKVLRDYRVRIVVAGTRAFDDYTLFSTGMHNYLERHFAGREVIFITGEAKTGADAMIIRWCEEHGYPWVGFPAKWDDLEAPGAVIRRRRDGVAYNVRAGYDRNRQMAIAGTNLIVWWDGVSGGTQDMIVQAAKRHLPTEKILISTPPKKVQYARESQGRGGPHFDLRGQAAAW